MSLRRASIALLIPVMVLTLAGCNLPMSRAGAKCSPTGKAAQDGTYLLSCQKNHRYKRTVTLAAANALVQAYLAAHAPHPTTTAPPPVVTTTTPAIPPTTVFGEGSYLVGSTAGHVPVGLYSTSSVGVVGCEWETFDSTGTVIGENVFTGEDILDVTGAATEVEVTGSCTWIPAPSTAVAIPASGNGTYRTGVEVQPGWYHIAGGANCFWEVNSSLDGSLDAVESADFSTQGYLLLVTSSDADIQIRDCGQLAPRANPSDIFRLQGSSGNAVIDGDSVGYDQSDTAITATVSTTTLTNDTLTVNANGYSMVIGAPTGSSSLGPAGGTVVYSGATAPGHAGGPSVTVTHGSSTCVADGTGGSLTLENPPVGAVVTDLTGALVIECVGGTTINIGEFHIA
jgi:hypothetical protein